MMHKELTGAGTETTPCLFAETGDRLAFMTGGSATERMTISSSGNVGIGNTAPVAKLHIGSHSENNMSVQSLYVSGAKTGYASVAGLPQNQLMIVDTTASTLGSGGAIGFGAITGSSQNTWIASINSERISATNDASNYGGNLVFYTRPAQTTPAARMTIQHDGNVGIGVTDPDSKLEVNGNIHLSGNLKGKSDSTTEIGLAFNNGGIKRIHMVQGGELHFGDTTTSNFLGLTEGAVDDFGDTDRLGLYYRNELKLYSNTNTLRMTIDSSGVLHLGSSASAAVIKNAKTGTALKIMNELNGGIEYYADANGHTFKTYSGSWLNALVIADTGEVGIRTSSPSSGYMLHIGPKSGEHTKVKIESSSATSQAELDLTANSSGVSYINLGDGDDYNIGRIGYFHSDNSMRFNTNNTEAMRIDENSTVGVGITDTSNAKGGEKLIVGGPSSHASGRWVNGWWEGVTAAWASYTYVHIKTSLWGGGSPAGNSQYIMGGFHIKGYHYGSGNINAVHQFHNWSGSLYNYSVLDNGNHTGQTHAYVGSDGYVYIRLTTNAYRMYIIDTVQYSLYTARTWTVTSVTGSSSATL
jgi:hypothetical protein